MTKATKEHHLTLNTSDEHTANLADLIHNMNTLKDEGKISDLYFVEIHNVLRKYAETDNFLSVVGYRDERESTQEYHIRVIEFPELADGTIRYTRLIEDVYYLLTNEELEKYITEQKEKN